MTREEAIQVLHSESVEISGNAVNISRFFEALDIAIAILHDVPDTDIGKNEPLTLDELRQMDGEPVWVVLSEKHRGWCLVSADCEAVFKQNAGCTFDEIIRNGVAYRQKPEEGTNE